MSSASDSAETRRTTCCVVGAGPAGVVLSFLLARQGVPVTLLEAHKDFDRDFRGDTLHPSTLELMDDLGLADRLLQLPHAKLEQLGFQTPDESLVAADFRKLKTKFPFIAMMPQVQFLEFMTQEAKKFDEFRLIMGANVQELIETDGKYRRVSYRDGNGVHQLEADLVVAADGRFSRLRKAASLEPVKTSPPMDVLWFRLPRRSEDTVTSNFRLGNGHLLVVLERKDDWQLGYVILKGTFSEIRDAGIAALHDEIARLTPEFADRVDHLTDWKQVTPLSVESSRLKKWHLPGLLLIGDAAHVMSPVGGVGINYAIQDAVAAANVLAAPLTSATVSNRDLAEVQRQREFPTRVIQTFQALVQKRIIRVALKPNRRFRIPLILRLPLLRTLPARLIAYGVRRSRLKQ